MRAYADNGVAVAYSANEVKFSTIAQTVQLTTDEVSCDVMDETAILNATMSNVGDPRFEERGFYYGTNPEPTSADYVVRDYGTAAGKYSAKIANLHFAKTILYVLFMSIKIQRVSVSAICPRVKSVQQNAEGQLL